ncbi:MAG TPA: hypothetical protein VLA44_02855, partial [Clostridia bacterium]|nr:hypothetical protein [Clostridia bacterium]
MRDLQQVHRADLAEELRVDLLLDVAGQQEPPAVHAAQQDDRDVVDAGAGVRRLLGHRSRTRPQNLQPDLVDGDAVPGREQRARWPATGELGGPCRVARPGAPHARLEGALDPVAPEEQREACDMVLVGVGQHDRVEATVP